MINKVLICNRGEIALRILRACRDLGIAGVVAYSAADRDSRAVRLADESFCVGPGPAGRSYLNIPALLHACAATGADAVHPGYGFLSEDAHFAQLCAELGITFIGPTAQVIAMMGDKTEARRLMGEAGLPVPAGMSRPVTGAEDAREQAARIGYPVILKAAAGGGGRGMAIVHDAQELPRALDQVQQVARSVFLDDRVYLEKYITSARHVEVQVLADGYGNVIHLGERDCSIQRRRQKLVEESPSTVLDEPLRRRMGEAAVRAAKAVGYRSAGTVEFLVDDQGRFYFMEMNTRIQVEHPVSEELTGVDLVAWMIRIAAGERLTLTQEDVRRSGHVIECRINAENPARDWVGSSGRLSTFIPPSGPGVRVETHGYPGYLVPPFYDSLLAKVIVRAGSREEALRAMDRALAEFAVTGVETTIDFHRSLLAHPRFRAGTHRLDFLDRYMRDGALHHEESRDGQHDSERTSP